MWISTHTQRQVFHPLASMHYDLGVSRVFDRTYISDENSERWAYPGMVLAVNNDGNLVPWNAAASYGAGSDTAVGMLINLLDLNYGNSTATYVWHAKLKQNVCYVYGGALGTIPAAVKTALDDFEWV